MFALRRHIPVLILVLLLSASIPKAQGGFALEYGPVLKKRLHERFLRILRGGDGYFYVLKGNSGSYWNFAAEGEHGVQIIRLDPQLRPVDTLRIRRWSPSTAPHNVYEVLPTPTGIGLLNVARSPLTGMAGLMLSEPHFDGSSHTFTTRQLDDLPGFTMGLDLPAFRHVFSPDSSHILLAWRRLGHEQQDDNSIACLVLDRNLQVVRGPFLPFKKFEQPISLREMCILSPEDLLFTVQAFSAGNAFQGPGTVSFGLIHYAVDEDDIRIVSFDKSRHVPVELRILPTDQGRIIVGGWYLDQQSDRRGAGVFIGEVTEEDSLESLARYPLDDTLREMLIRREKRSGAVSIRSSYMSTLLPTDSGYAFVLHLRGPADKGVDLRSPGSKTNNALHTWVFDDDFDLRSHSVTGFYSAGREEMMETFSWRPLQVGGQWFAFAADYSKVRNEAKPTGAVNYAWQLPGFTFDLVHEAAGKDYTLIAPREMVQVGAGEWVGIALSGKRWRLVRVR